MQEHRYVMQQHIGRPLLASEQVHHKDGNRENNNIDNLELRAGAHGTGIRAEDGAIRCIEYLEKYYALDLWERTVLASIKDKAKSGNLGMFLEPNKKEHKTKGRRA